MPGKAPFVFDDVEGDVLLLVEGIEDARFFRAFLRWLGKTDVQIAHVGGKDEFRPFLINTLRNAQSLNQLRRLGIVRDADKSATSALQSLQNALVAARFPALSQALTVAQSNGLAVSLAILPDGESVGDLEELCLHSIDNTPEFACVGKYIECRVREGAQMADHRLAKTKVHTYLAVGIDGKDPGLRLGEAAEAGVWDWNSPAFAQITDFLSKLYSPPPTNQPE